MESITTEGTDATIDSTSANGISASPSPGTMVAGPDGDLWTISAPGSERTSTGNTFAPDNHETYTLAVSYSGDQSHQISSGQSNPINTAVMTPPPLPISVGGGTTTPGVGYSVSASVPVRPADVASVQLDCTGTNLCNVTVTVSVIEKLRGGKLIAITALTRPHRRTKTTFKKVVVGTSKVTIAAGSTRTIKVHLNATGRRLVVKHRLKTKLTITQTGSTTVHTATFTAPKRGKPVRTG